jgi:hypothetical protein
MTDEKEIVMEKRAWTARGTVTETDKDVIRGLTRFNLIASRILVTGEVHEGYIGDMAEALLMSSNDMQGEPLFVRTRVDTIQMARFEPEVVWRLFHPDIVMKLVGEEDARLGFDVCLDEPDYYQSLIRTLVADGEIDKFLFPVAPKYGSLDTFYQIMYLGCLLLFEKPGYMAVPVSQHFALPETVDFMHQVQYRELSLDEMMECVALSDKFQGIQGITNPELNFLVKLYDADAKR